MHKYHQEYLQTIYQKTISGVSINKWKNYHNFISVLQIIIEDNTHILKKNQKTIEENLKHWSQNKNQVEIWKYLRIKNKKKILKIKNIKEQTLNDNYIQLKFLKKG